MALVLIDGFDYYQAGIAAGRGWSGSPSSMQPGRFGGQCFRMVGGNFTLTRPLPSSYTTLIAGFAVRFNILGAAQWFQLRAGATMACELDIDGTTGRIVVKNSGGTVIATGTTSIVPNNWYYVELKLFVNGASGSIELHLNGISEIASTTGNFGTTAIDNVGMRALSVTQDYDDMYVLDTTGAAPRNTFLGDVRVGTIYPTADGAHTAWTPNIGTAHFSRVNEASGTFPDGDTSYVADATPGDYDTYAFGDIDTLATPLAVQVNLYARKDDAATRQIAPVIRQAGVDHDGAPVALGSTYAYFSQIYQQDPTGSDWTAANVNADEIGVKEVA